MLIRGHKVLKRFTNAHVLPLLYNHIIALDEMEEKLEDIWEIAEICRKVLWHLNGLNTVILNICTIAELST